MKKSELQKAIILALTLAGLEILWGFVYGRLPVYLLSPTQPLLAVPLNALVHIGITAAVFCVLWFLFSLPPIAFFKNNAATLTASAYASYVAVTVVSRYLFLNEALSPAGYRGIVVATIAAAAAGTFGLSRLLARRGRFVPVFLVVGVYISLAGLFLKFSLHPWRFFSVFVPLLIAGHLVAWLLLRRFKPGPLRFTGVFMAAVFAATLGRGIFSAAGGKPADPHIVFLVIDAVRADRMSLHGYELSTTPFIDSLADSGSLVFDHAYSTSNYTYPSHVSMLTALYNRSHNMWHGADAELERYREIDNLAGSLSDRGYRTMLLTENAWIAGLTRGFDHYHYLEIGGTPVSGWMGPMERLSATPSGFLPFAGNTPSPFAARQLLDQLIFSFQSYYKPVVEDYELRLMFEQMLLRRRRRSLFYFINWMTVHNRYYPAPGREFGKTIFPYDWSRDYDQAMIHADRRFRGLWELFARTGDLKDTVFVITSDHGELLGEYNIYGHTRAFFQGVIRIPLLFIHSAWEGRLAVNSPVSLVPFKPALKLLVDRFDSGLRREELADEFIGQPVVAEHRSIHPGPDGEYLTGWMIVSPEKMKLIYDQEAPSFQSTWGSEEFFLFDLERDPEETENLYHLRPETAEELKQLYREWKEETPPAPPMDPGRIAPGLRERLRAAGYL